jgi:Zn-dependent protease
VSVDRFEPVTAPEPAGAPEPEPYDPPRRRSTRDLVARLVAPVVVLVGLAVKFGAPALKFLSVFVAVGGYALIWGWRFAVGFVALILVHELGHFFEARRQGLRPSLPVFIPFLGAYVAIKGMPFDPWRNVLVSLAGPVAGGVGALAMLGVGEAQGSQLLVALAYAGFLLNLINLIPIGFLDGGFTWRSIKVMRHGGGHPDPAVARRRATVALAGYAALAGLLVLGMVAAHVPQDRL